MIEVILIFEIVILLLAGKALLFWVYLFQLKEYRFDRLWAEYGRPEKLTRFWVAAGGRKLYVPRWTVKAILVSFVSFATLFLVAGQVGIGMPEPFYVGAYVALYFAVPVLASAVVTIFKIPTFLAKQLIYILAARKIRAFSHLVVVGVTGSYGKSSTKEFLAYILSRKFRVVKTPGNTNTEIGVAWYALRRVKADTEVFIAEVGAYRRGEIATVCRIIHPRIGLLTGISEQHAALFGSVENIKKAKFELIESLPADGFAAFNGENEDCVKLASGWKGKRVLYRRDPSVKPDFPPHYQLNLSGAIAVARYLGMTDEEVREGVESIRLGQRMMRSFTGRGGALVIDDTYSANPDGVRVALEHLARQLQQRKIIVMPCLIELGATASEAHKKIGEQVGRICDYAVITTGDYFREIQEHAGEKAILASSPGQVVEFLKDKMNPESAVLLEGRLSPRVIEFVQ